LVEERIVGVLKGPTEGGSDGKRGHSNMEHWGFTEDVKDVAKRRRRLDDKAESARGRAEAERDSK